MQQGQRSNLELKGKKYTSVFYHNHHSFSLSHQEDKKNLAAYHIITLFRPFFFTSKQKQAELKGGVIYFYLKRNEDHSKDFGESCHNAFCMCIIVDLCTLQGITKSGHGNLEISIYFTCKNSNGTPRSGIHYKSATDSYSPFQYLCACGWVTDLPSQ